MLGPWLWWACAQGTPAPLPTSPVAVQVDARMVRAGEAGGYLARPRSPEGPLPGRLRLVEDLGEAHRVEARDAAAEGLVVLVSPAEVPQEAALRYLQGTGLVSEVTVSCERASCRDQGDQQDEG